MATKKTQTHAQTRFSSSNGNRQRPTSPQTSSSQRQSSTDRQTQRALIIWRIYSFLITPFKAWAVSQTGIIHHCRHSPSCGVYMAEQISLGSLSGIKKGLKQFWNCR